MEGEGLCALLTCSVGRKELLHYLKHPECASSTSSRILQQIPRKIGEPAPQDAINEKLHGIFIDLGRDQAQIDAKALLPAAFFVLCISSLLLMMLDDVQMRPA